MSNTFRFFLIESGRLLEMAKAMRAEYDAVHDQYKAFAVKYGADRYCISGGGFFAGRVSQRLCGLATVHPRPAGWKLDRSKRYMEPYAKQKALWEEIKALPNLPNLRGEISKAIGWEMSYQSTEHPDRTYGRPSCQLLCNGTAFCIAAPLCTDFGEALPDTVKAAMAHPVPEGCREITAAEWELIRATEKVAKEQAA